MSVRKTAAGKLCSPSCRRRSPQMDAGPLETWNSARDMVRMAVLVTGSRKVGILRSRAPRRNAAPCISSESGVYQGICQFLRIGAPIQPGSACPVRAARFSREPRTRTIRFPEDRGLVFGLSESPCRSHVQHALSSCLQTAEFDRDEASAQRLTRCPSRTTQRS